MEKRKIMLVAVLAWIPLSAWSQSDSECADVIEVLNEKVSAMNYLWREWDVARQGAEEIAAEIEGGRDDDQFWLGVYSRSQRVFSLNSTIIKTAESYSEMSRYALSACTFDEERTRKLHHASNEADRTRVTVEGGTSSWQLLHSVAALYLGI